MPSRRLSSYSSIREMSAVPIPRNFCQHYYPCCKFGRAYLTLIQLLLLLLEEIPLLHLTQLIQTQNMKPRYPLMAFNVLFHAPTTLKGEVLADATGAVAEEVVGIFEGGEGGGEGWR